MSSKKTTNNILIISLIFFAILYTVCRFLISPSFGEGVFYGFLLSAVNFFSLSRKIRTAFEENEAGVSFVGGQFRLLISAGMLVLFIKYMDINVFGILVGISNLPLSILGYVIYKSIAGKDNGTPT